MISFSSLAMATPVKLIPPPTQEDINNEVSAMQDAQNQKNYDDAQKAYNNNRGESDEYSNCPNRPH